MKFLPTFVLLVTFALAFTAFEAEALACECTRMSQPTCATNGKVYGNPCMFYCAKTQNQGEGNKA